ncbi:protein of unknown function [Pseudomonas inefficax]|uniref:Uncharacterized protein n=1 Tax=Pseudomonas inefficax TaxID=2078786 RepID=A0AAQ1P511_9PSED|nr:protein of unknown function [Pseudomonas inefficax]
MGAALAANTGAAGAMHRVACFAGLPAPTGMEQVWACATPVGAGAPAKGPEQEIETPRQAGAFWGNAVLSEYPTGAVPLAGSQPCWR